MPYRALTIDVLGPSNLPHASKVETLLNKQEAEGYRLVAIESKEQSPSVFVFRKPAESEPAQGWF